MRCFFDTNILVYMQDSSDLNKQNTARKLFTECVKNQTAVISTQVLQEFYNIAANKLHQDKNATKAIVRNFANNLDLVTVTFEIIENAVDLNIANQFSIWDAIIISAAQSGNCDILYSEDLNDGQRIGNLVIKNPF